MSIVSYKDGLDDGKYLPEYFEPNNATRITVRSATSFRYTNADGTVVTATGSGFAYDDGTPVGGTITAINVAKGAATLLSITQLSHALDDFFYQAFGWGRDDRPRQNGDGYQVLSALLSGNDTINGSAGGDDIIGGTNEGDDLINGLAGDDYITGLAGKDTVNGGEGFDTLTFEETHFLPSARRGILLDVAAGTVVDSWGYTDRFTGIEEFKGSRFADTMRGSGDDDQFTGFRGADLFDGRGNGDFDTVKYQDDVRFGGNKGIVANFAAGTVRDGFGALDKIVNIEYVEGTKFADSYVGNATESEFGGGAGIDKYTAGTGFDNLDFFGPQAVLIDLTKPTEILNDGFGNKEAVTGVIEAFWGGDKNDVFRGDAAGNTFGGSSGDDLLIGAGGNDNLRGNSGNDTLTGGAGDDRFVWRRQSDGFGGDKITDFVSGEDQINFRFNSFTGMDGTVRFNLGNHATHAGSSFFFNAATHQLAWDPDGTGAKAAFLVATLTGVNTMTADDILLT